jgi:hypothetical protein
MTQDIVIGRYTKDREGVKFGKHSHKNATKHKNKGPPFRFSHNSKYTLQNKNPNDPPSRITNDCGHGQGAHPFF